MANSSIITAIGFHGERIKFRLERIKCVKNSSWNEFLSIENDLKFHGERLSKVIKNFPESAKEVTEKDSNFSGLWIFAKSFGEVKFHLERIKHADNSIWNELNAKKNDLKFHGERNCSVR